MPSSPSAKVAVHLDQRGAEVSRHLYGHFAEHLGRCIYDGIWVGPASPVRNINGFRADIVDALKAIKIPNLRWPGGCFADDYHWRDGIGPRESRPRTVNIHWGNAVEDNSFGTHEFFELCELLECDPYVAFNVGSGSPTEMRQWLEYITFDGRSTLADERRANGRDKPWRLPFAGIGNENWGCGGNMTPEFYSDLHNQFRAYAREFSGNKMTRIACGPNSEDHQWAEVLLDRARGLQGMSWHYYAVHPNWQSKRAALADDEASWHGSLAAAERLEAILSRAEQLFDAKDPENRIGIYFDEWGAWHATEPGGSALYQQNTICDALVASLSLDIFNRHCRRVRMANIAQTVNVLQAMILTEPGGGRMLLTPTYHVFDLYKIHHDATGVPVSLEAPQYSFKDRSIGQISSSASLARTGELNLTLSNLHPDRPIEVDVDISGMQIRDARGRILTAQAMNSHNSFDAPAAVRPEEFSEFTLSGGALKTHLPPRGIVALQVT